MRRLIFCTILLFLLPLGLKEIHAKTWKWGFYRAMPQITYKYETKILADADASEATTDVSQEDSGTTSSTEFFLEWLLWDLIGLELNIGLTPGTRNFTFATNGLDGEETKIGDIEQSVGLSTGFGFNIYFMGMSKDSSYHPFFGVMQSSYTVAHSYANGGDRDDDETDTLTGFKASQSSSITAAAMVIKIGVDWMLEGGAGLRLQYLSFTSENENSLGNTSFSAEQTETTTLAGGISLGLLVSF